MLKRSLKSEFIAFHAPIAVVKLDQLPCRAEDRRVPLPLPEFDIKGTVRLPEAAESLHDEIGLWHPGSGSLHVRLPLVLRFAHPFLTSPARCLPALFWF